MVRYLVALSLLLSGAAYAQVPFSPGLQQLPGFPRGQQPGGGGTAAATGNIGQVLSSTVTCSATTGLTSGAVGNITSLSLTPGIWTLSGVVATQNGTGTTTSFAFGGISTSTSGAGTPQTTQATPTFGIGFGAGNVIAPMVYWPAVSVTTTTTYYINVDSTFSGGTAGPCGSLQAVRIA
jgi:hypothetical protein